MTSELKPDTVKLQAELDSIRSQVNDLLYRLAEVEHQLHSMSDKQATDVNGPATLEDFVVEVLQNSNESLTAREITDLVLDSGYKTTSKNFINVVLQILFRSPAIRWATRGKTRPVRYTLAKK